MRKLKLFLSLLMVMLLSVGNVWGDEVTFAYGDYKGEGTTSSGSAYTMSDKDDVTIGDTKFYGNNSYAHFYASGVTTITPASGVTITKIVLTASSSSYNGYQSSGTMTWSKGSSSANDAVVTWTGSATAAFTLSHNKQIRWTSIVVTYSKGGSTPDPDPTPGEDPEPTDDADVVLDFSQNWGLPTSSGTKKVEEESFTDGTHTIKVAGTTGNGYYISSSTYLLLGKNGAYVILPEFSSPIEKIVCEAGASGASTSVKWNVFDGNTAVSTEVTGCTTDNTFEIENPTANKAYKIKVGSNHNLQIAKIKIYFEPASSKEAAGLAFETAAYLVKANGSLATPTLSTAEGFDGTVTYASSDANVVAVNATTGALTIKAAGKAEITASSLETENFKAGSAKYTIYVAEQAGTAEDPLSEASAKALIDLGCTMNVYMVGTVATKNYYTSSKTYTVDLAGGMQYYYFYEAAGETVFETDYLKVGDVITAYGTLKKASEKYRLNPSYMVNRVEYTEPLNDISNTKETAYSVATALTKATDPTSDLDNSHVFITGVVYNVKNFDSENGTLDIYIKDAGVDNKFEFFKCKGINDGSTTTPFASADDVQVGNVVIGYGMLKYYSGGSIWEFDNTKDGDYLVELQAPVTGVELNATAEVEEGSTVNLTATILPSNATGTIDWSVESGSDKASVENGVVTGIAEGEAVIRATVQGTEIYAECTVTVTEKSAPVSYDYALVTDAAQLQDGLKVIIVAANEDKAAGSAAATYRNVVDVERTTDGNYLILDGENMPTEFTIGVSGDNFTFNDGDGYMYESAVKSVKVQDEAFEWTISIGDGNIATIGAPNGDLKYNSGSPRFTTYASGQQALQLYVKNDGKQAAGLAWSASEVELTVGDPFEAPTLTNPNNLVVTITSDNEEVATVSEGIVSLVADATGTAKITASYAGDDTYRAASVSYTITVNAAAPTPAETKNVVILAEYNSKFYAMTNSLTSGALAAVEVEKDGDKIVVFAEADKNAIQWTMTANTTTATFQDADDKYLAHTGTGTNLALQADAEEWTWDSEKGCYYMVVDSKDRAFMYYKDGIFKNYATSNLAPDKTDYSGAPEIIEIAAEDIILSEKAEPQLAYTPAEVTLTVGGEFTPAVLSYAEGFDGLAEVTYASNNKDVATVDEDGVVSLVADATGTATITATFAGNNNYLAGSASYVITVNEAGDDLTGTWVLASSVVAGDKFIVVGSYNNKTMAMGKQNSNNRAAVASSVDEWNVLTPGADTKVFTLVDAGEGKFAIQASNGKYLSAAGTGTNNYLREAADFEADNAKWTISIENGVANVVASSNNRNVMRYNSTNNSELFSCYQSGAQRDIQIFKLGTPDYGSYQRNVTEDNYGTICLPQAGTITGATLFEIASFENGMIYMDEVGSTMEAGKPYIFQATATQLNVTYTSGDVEENAGIANGLHGFYDLNDEDAKNNLDQDDGNYILYSNAYWLVSGRAAYIANYRAYIKIGEIENTPAPEPTPGQAPRRRVAMSVHGEQTATGMENVQGDNVQCTKVLIDGQLFILRGEKMYDVKGQLVK